MELGKPWGLREEQESQLCVEGPSGGTVSPSSLVLCYLIRCQSGQHWIIVIIQPALGRVIH